MLVRLKKDGTPRKPRTAFYIVDSNSFAFALKQEEQRRNGRARQRIIEGRFLFQATLTNEDATPERPQGRPYYAYTGAQALAWAGKKRGVYLSPGRFFAVESSVWYGQCHAVIVTCLTRFDRTRPSLTAQRPLRLQLDFADAHESGFVARNAALPDPMPAERLFQLTAPEESHARRRATRRLRIRRAVDNRSLDLPIAPNA